ncbi:MAG: hypothetical protein H6845_02470 [Alphaproteobacteria bacterium]|nr:MAG: hypothetical protein H6845_02470 [Alphaproteobacteria bacterium]
MSTQKNIESINQTLVHNVEQIFGKTYIGKENNGCEEICNIELKECNETYEVLSIKYIIKINTHTKNENYFFKCFQLNQILNNLHSFSNFIVKAYAAFDYIKGIAEIEIYSTKEST